MQKRPAGLWAQPSTDCSRFEELGAFAVQARGLVVDLGDIFGATAINERQRVILVKGGSAGLGGGTDGRQKRDLWDERVTEVRFEELAYDMDLGYAMIGFGKALVHQFVGVSLQPALHQDGVALQIWEKRTLSDQGAAQRRGRRRKLTADARGAGQRAASTSLARLHPNNATARQ